MKKHLNATNIFSFVLGLILITTVIISANYKVNEITSVNTKIDQNLTEITRTELFNDKNENLNTVLPTKLPNSKYFMYLDINKTNKYTPLYIEIKSINTRYTLSIDGKTFYESTKEPKLKNLEYPSVNLINIPKKYYGREIKINFNSLYPKSKFINIPKISLGSKESILQKAQADNSAEIIFSSILFLIGYISTFSAIILFKTKANYHQIFYIASFSLLMSAITIINTDIIKLILPENKALYYTYYILFSLLTTPALLLIHYEFSSSFPDNWRAKFTRYIFYTELTITLLEIIYIIKNYNQQINCQLFINTNIALSIIAATICIISLNNKERKVKSALLASIIPIVLLFSENLALYLNIIGIIKNSHYTAMYGLAFITITLYVVIKTYTNSYKNLEMTKFYERIAFVDSLTGVGTRHALENEINKIIEQDISKRIIIMFIDLNSLKQINDKKGHTIGDKVIKTLGTLLLEVEHMYTNISSYRFGGDEFIIIMTNPRKEIAENIKVYLTNKTDLIRNNSSDVPISIAIAYDEIELEKNMDIDDIIKNADNKMYLDKLRRKSSNTNLFLKL